MDYKILKEITVGVIAGILTFISLEAGKIVILKLIYLFRNVFYDAVNIKGKWEGAKIDKNIKFGFKFKLRQFGHLVSGIYESEDIYPKSTEVETPISTQDIKGSALTEEININSLSSYVNKRTFKVKGTIKNNYLILSYHPKSRKRIGGGSFIFQVLDDGNKILGSMCYHKTSNGNTGAAQDIVLIRTK